MKVSVWFLLCAWNVLMVEYDMIHHRVGWMTMIGVFGATFCIVQCFKAIKPKKEGE